MEALTQRSVRQAATGPQPNSRRLDVWGGGEYDVGEASALDAICHGDEDLLMESLRQAEELSPKVSCALADALAEMLDPNSSHTWRLHLKRRRAGNPRNAASLVSVDSALKRICETPISIESAHEIAEMLAPDSDHRFRLHLRKRKRGPVPPSPWVTGIPGVPFDKERIIREALKRPGKREANVHDLKAQRISRRMTFFVINKLNLKISLHGSPTALGQPEVVPVV